MSAITQFLFYSVAVPAGSALAVLVVVLRFAGEAIFGHFLSERLEKQKTEYSKQLVEQKHEHDKQIEDLRAKIALLTDRGKHSNEREYAALSTAWEKLVDLYYATRQCVWSVIEYPDLNRMTEAEVAELLDTTALDKGQKAAVLKADDKNRSYAHILRRIAINKAFLEHIELTLLLHKNSIFIDKSITEQFNAIAEMCSMAIAHRYVEERGARLDNMHDLEFVRRGPKAFEEITRLVRDKLLVQQAGEL